MCVIFLSVPSHNQNPLVRECLQVKFWPFKTISLKHLKFVDIDIY